MSNIIRFRGLPVIAVCFALVCCGEDKDKEEDGSDSGAEHSGDVFDSGVSKDSGNFADSSTSKSRDANDGRIETADAEDTGKTTDTGITACSMSLGVECDGDEDCPDEQVCCGTYRSTQSTAGYTSIDCQLTCRSEFDFDPDADDDAGVREMPDIENVREMKFKLCHKGEECSIEGSDAETEVSCWASSVLPSFLGVCLSSSTTFGEPVSDTSANAVAGEINCGDETCTVGTEKCCLAGFPANPYCTAIENECDCDSTP